MVAVVVSGSEGRAPRWLVVPLLGGAALALYGLARMLVMLAVAVFALVRKRSGR